MDKKYNSTWAGKKIEKQQKAYFIQTRIGLAKIALDLGEYRRRKLGILQSIQLPPQFQ